MTACDGSDLLSSWLVSERRNLGELRCMSACTETVEVSI